MAEGFVHTVSDAHWETPSRGRTEWSAASLPTKAEAAEAGRAEAQRRNTEHVIHRQDGSIEERNSYGGDPAHWPG